jgi:Zn-dependent protease
MQWSVTVGRIAGTAVRIHVTFIVFLLWIAVADTIAFGPAAAWRSVVFLVLVFACVLAHEFGHILTARSFGVRTPDVTLLPIGGVASLERIPENPGQELLIAIAGPLVNVAIAAVLVVAGGISAGELQPAGFDDAALLPRLAVVNAALVLFNLVPAFPMDGGRVLRALLAMPLGLQRATQIATRLGQAFAFLFMLAGLFLNPMLIFIGMFIYFAAVAERQASAFRWFAADLQVADGMERAVRTLPGDTPLAEAVDALLATPQRDFPVIDAGNRPVGLLDRDRLLAGLKEGRPDLKVAAVMQPTPAIGARHPLGEAVMEMNRLGLRSRMVVDADGRFAGMLTLDNVAEMMMIRDRLPEWRFARRGGA